MYNIIIISVYFLLTVKPIECAIIVLTSLMSEDVFISTSRDKTQAFAVEPAHPAKEWDIRDQGGNFIER